MDTGSTATAFERAEHCSCVNLRKLDSIELRSDIWVHSISPRTGRTGRLVPAHLRPPGGERSSPRFRNHFLQCKQIHGLQTPSPTQRNDL